jgi:hypothetical protein
VDQEPEFVLEEFTPPTSLPGYIQKGQEVSFEDRQRASVTRWLLLLLTFVATALLATVFIDDAVWNRAKDYISLVFVPLLTLTGSAVGYYFAGRRGT